MNKKLASAGLLVVALSLLIATGAVSPTDEVSAPDSSGNVEVSPVNGPNGDAYVTTEEGRINVTLLRLNPRSTVFLDRLFKIGYEGNGTAEFWIEDGTSETVFYAGESRPVDEIEGRTNSVELAGDIDTTLEVGMKADTTNGSDILSDIDLIARLPEEDEEDITVDPIPGGGGGGGGEDVVEREDEVPGDGGGSVDEGMSVIRVDAGEVAVTVRQPNLRYSISVSDTRVAAAQEVSGVATVLDTRSLETGEELIVSSQIENVGTGSARETVELTVDGDVADTKEIEIEPGETEEVEFTLTFGEPGSYAVEVGDSDAVTVTAYEEGVPAYLLIFVAILISTIAATVGYRRYKQDKE